MSRTQFREQVEGELQSMGWPAKSYLWASASRLILIVNGQLREFTLHAGMSKAARNRQLGRLEGMADMLNLGGVA